MSVVIAHSLADATPLILRALAKETTVDVWIEPEFVGYWAQLRPNPKDAAEMTLVELKRAVRKQKKPQPYDVLLIEWDAFMYRGYHNHRKSSAF